MGALYVQTRARNWTWTWMMDERSRLRMVTCCRGGAPACARGVDRAPGCCVVSEPVINPRSAHARDAHQVGSGHTIGGRGSQRVPQQSLWVGAAFAAAPAPRIWPVRAII